MSYNTLSLITTTENKAEYEEMKNHLQGKMDSVSIREIYRPFIGIVAQVNLKSVEGNFEDLVVAFSKQYNTKHIAIINLECYAGKCGSEGKVYLNGMVGSEEDYSYDSHVKLLTKVSYEYSSWHFEPFTRDYFTKRAGIWGEIRNESFMMLSVMIHMAYAENPNYTVQITENELVIRKEGFHLYFMKPSVDCIKVLGSIHTNFDENLITIKAILNEFVAETKSYIFIEDIEKGTTEKINNWGDDQLIESGYRHVPFNVQSLDLNPNNLEEKEDVELKTKKVFTGDKKLSFWKKITTNLLKFLLE